MCSANERVQLIENRLGMLKSVISRLNEASMDKRIKDFLVSSGLGRLSVVEGSLLPNGLKAPTPAKADALFEMAEFQLTQAEMQLKYAEGIVMKHGAPLRSVSAAPVVRSKMIPSEARA